MFYSTSWTSCISVISLFSITNVNAQCLKPTGNVNVILTNDALLKNDFPEGSDVTFECANGYVKDYGSESVTCSNRTWSVLELTCKKRDCGPPPPKPKLNYVIESGGTLFGALARAYCDKGYQLQGPSYSQCIATGWIGKPKCEVFTCPKPIEIINGIISVKPDKEFPEYGDAIQYSCNQGYTLIGDKSSVCNEVGNYTSTPECKDNILLKAPTTTISSSVTITSSTVSPKKQGLGGHNDTTEYGADTGNAVLVGSVLGTVIVALIVLFILYHFLKKKGSYQTGEDQRRKEELL